MSSDDSFEVPFDVDAAPRDAIEPDASDRRAGDPVDGSPSGVPGNESSLDAEARQEVDEAREAFERDGGPDQLDDFVDDPEAVSASQPFVQSWQTLISQTNWEKGRIISQWRKALIDGGAAAMQFSDQAWVRRVGGVTAPHVGRLRRVHDRFGEDHASYEKLYWTHFLAALDWDDAAMWLQGANDAGWSISEMRAERARVTGVVESGRMGDAEIIAVDLDEDVTMPAQGGGSNRTFRDDEPPPSGPRSEDPDFGDEAISEVDLGDAETYVRNGEEKSQSDPAGPGPFFDLPELPEDLAEAVESMKLAILRHKTSGFGEVQVETLRDYLRALGKLLD